MPTKMILNTVFYAFFTATIAYLFYTLTERGAPLYGYVRYLRYRFYYAGLLYRTPLRPGLVRYPVAKAGSMQRLLRKLYAPLGGCVVCMHFWATLCWLVFFETPEIYPLATLAFGHFILTARLKKS